MRLNAKSKNIEITPSLNTFIEGKLGKLEKFLKRMEETREFVIDVEVSRTTKHHKKGNVYRAEANLEIGKKLLRAESESADLRVSIGEVYKELEREIVKFKEKLQVKNRKS